MSYGIEEETSQYPETDSSAYLSQFSNSVASAPLRELTDKLVDGEIDQNQSRTEQNLSLRVWIYEDYYLQLLSDSERSS